MLDDKGNEIVLKDSSAEELENVRNVVVDDIGESVNDGKGFDGFYMEDENGDAIEEEADSYDDDFDSDADFYSENDPDNIG